MLKYLGSFLPLSLMRSAYVSEMVFSINFFCIFLWVEYQTKNLIKDIKARLLSIVTKFPTTTNIISL